jgi:hypothetical protein
MRRQDMRSALVGSVSIWLQWMPRLLDWDLKFVLDGAIGRRIGWRL